MKPTAAMIEKQKKLVNSINFDTDRERFEFEFDKLSVMREAVRENEKLPHDWCTSDGEWWVAEAQKHCTEFSGNQLGKLYDALKSGELNVPE